MAVTTTYSWTFLNNISDVSLAPGANAEVISLTGRAFAVSVDHNSLGGHIDGDLFNLSGTWVDSWNDGLDANGTNSALAQLSNGNIVQVSQDADSILYEIRNTAGGVVLASDDAELVADTAETNADVAALAGGGFVIARQDFFGGIDNDISLTIYNNAGVITTAQFNVDFSGADERDASVAGLVNGNFVVAYTRTIGADTEVRYAIYNSVGGVVLAAGILDTIGSVNRNVSVTALANGGFAVAYEDDGWLTGTVDITVGTYTSTGVFVHQAKIGSTTDDANPYIAQLANGMLVVAFSRDLGDFDTYVKLLDSSTLDELASDTITAGDSLFDNTINPAIAGYGYGQVAVVHTNVTDGVVQGETLQAVRTSISSSASDTIVGDDLIDLMSGNNGNDKLYGKNNNDVLNGNGGNDRLDGAAGVDILNGGGDKDILIGGNGNDKLNGGGGSDVLTGDGNNDTFIFQNGLGASNIDIITDFSHANDTIKLENSVFTGLAAGTLAVSQFHIGPAAADASDRIIYNFATGALYFDFNGSLAGGSIQFAKLDPGLGLNNTDFVVI